MDFDLYKSLLVTCSFGHLRKNIATHVRSTELKLDSVRPKKVVSMKSFERVCPSEFINRVAQYVHMLTGRMHTFFNFTCLLISFARYML